MKCRLGVLLLLLLPVFSSAETVAQTDDNDPAVVCKEKPADARCVGYLGATSGSDPRFGGSGTASDRRRDNARYTIFVHTGGGDAALGEKLARLLAEKGFVVRGVDNKIDSVGGPGVDYFSEQDRQGASEVAEIVNSVLPQGQKRREPRFQRVENPFGFLGVWLYGQAAETIDPALWSSRVPTVAWCYQQNRQTKGPGNYLVHCHYTKERCEKVRGPKTDQTTDCPRIDLAGANWQPSPGGYLNAWFQYSPTPFRPPFPQFTTSPVQ